MAERNHVKMGIVYKNSQHCVDRYEPVGNGLNDIIESIEFLQTMRELINSEMALHPQIVGVCKKKPHQNCYSRNCRCECPITP